jgi:hypothetical protein
VIFFLFLFFILCGDGAIDRCCHGVLGNHGRNRLKRGPGEQVFLGVMVNMAGAWE